MAYSQRPNTQPVYDAAARWVDAALRSDDSLFTPGSPVWTAQTVDDLYQRFNLQPDESSNTFMDKFRLQLAGAPERTVQLAAELVYFHLLVANDMLGSTKRDLVADVLSSAPGLPAPPDDLSAVLDTGLTNTGIAFKTFRPNQLWLLVDFARAWKGVGDDEHKRLLSDPWAFKEFLWAVPMTAAFAQRNALLHFVHPETFEAIVSREHKGRIAAFFAKRAADPDGDVDRALLDIRRSFEAEVGDSFDFYRGGVEEQWRPVAEKKAVTGGEETATRRAWLVRGANVNGHNLISSWLTVGYCSIGWADLGELPSHPDRQELQQRMLEAFPDESAQTRSAYTGVVHRFLSQMAKGDTVVTVDGKHVYHGVVESDPYWQEGEIPEASRRRQVTWTNPSEPLLRADLPDRVFAKLRSLFTVTEMTDVLGELDALIAPETVVGPVAPERVHLRPATDKLAQDLHLPKAWLDEVIRDLDAKRQLIFYGPPGTSKTYVARALAEHLTTQPENAMLVQFHPSYTYEDFFEGFRPRPGSGGTVSFELVPGPLKRLAEAAHNDPKSPYVLVIDEINRANLAKVFGELYFLLEYREDAVTLQYSPDATFSLPGNLFVIGTMNTADRSIARVDAAMRRRFWFVEFFPNRHPVNGLLRQWLIDTGRPTGPADLLEALNARIGDPDFAIGPSYLMTDRSATPDGLRSIWARAILPLLEEQFYGGGMNVTATFGVDALLQAAAPVPVPEEEDGELSPVKQLELTEHELSPGVELEAHEARLLPPRIVSVSPSAAGTDRWDLRPSSYVGAFRAGDLEVRVAPKVPVDRLLFLLAYARNQSGWQRTLAGFREAPDLVTAVAMGFLYHAERALTPHVLHGYLAVEEELTTLRGRLREGEQLRRRFGLMVPVSVAYDEFTIDIPENRLILTAALRLQRLWGLPGAGRIGLRQVVTRLEGVSELPTGAPLPTVVSTRLNAHYGPALDLADLILKNLSIEASVGHRSSVGFLFDMNRVFEDFLTAALSTELARFGGRVVPQYPLTLDQEERVLIKPDLVWRSGARSIAVMDAKYRAVAPTDMPNAHLYQMLAYCTALGLDDGWLVYAAGNATAFTSTVERAGIAIRSTVLDLALPPEQLLASVRSLAGEIARIGDGDFCPRHDGSGRTVAYT